MHVATITIDHTKVAADLTDYVVAVINNSDAGWAELYAIATSGGGDIRVYKAGGVTELPREIVSFSVVGETGEIHIKYTGTLSASVDTDIEIHADGTSSDYAVGATYGRNAVWSGFLSVYHLQTSSSDSTGNYSGTDTSITYGSQNKIGQGASATSGKIATASYSLNAAFSFMAWIRATVDVAGIDTIFSTYNGSGTGSGTVQFQNVGTSLNYSNFVVDTSKAASLAINTWYHVGFKHNGTTVELYKDGASLGTGTVAHATTTRVANLFSRGDVSTNRWRGGIDEARIINSEVTTALFTTNYNNQNSPSTFYSVTAEGGTITVTPAAQTATSSLQAPTVTAVRNVTITPAVLTATSAAQTSSPSGDAVYGATPLTATATAPVVVIDAGGNITIAVSVMTATAALQAPTVTVESNITISPAVLSAIGSAQAPSVAVGTGATIAQAVQAITAAPQSPTVVSEQSRIITPAVMPLTASAITPTKNGPLWTPVGRAGDADEWTAVERVT